MTKLQMIKRAKGSESYSSNIPLAMIKDLDWKKGDNLTIEVIGEQLVICREGVDDGRD